MIAFFKKKSFPTILYLFGWFVVALSSLLYTPYLSSYEDIISMAVFCACVSLGLLIGGGLVGRIFNQKGSSISVRFNTVMLVIAIIGCGCKIIDRVYLRPITDIDIGGSARLSRQSGGNAVSIVAGFLLPFTAVYFYIFNQYKNQLYLFFSRIPALLLTIDFFLTASRGTMLICSVLFIRPKNAKQILGIGVLGLGISSLMYNQRAVNTGTTDLVYLSSISSQSAFMHNIDMTGFGEKIMEYIHILIAEPVLHLAAYLSHSISEANFVFHNESPFTFRPYFALSQISVLYKLLNMEVVEAIRSGLYYGFHGNCFLAFGYFGFIHAIVGGIWLSFILMTAIRFQHVPFSILFAACIMLSPCVDTVSGYDLIIYQLSYIIVLKSFGRVC